jgi:hypothetical protein
VNEPSYVITARTRGDYVIGLPDRLANLHVAIPHSGVSLVLSSNQPIGNRVTRDDASIDVTAAPSVSLTFSYDVKAAYLYLPVSLTLSLHSCRWPVAKNWVTAYETFFFLSLAFHGRFYNSKSLLSQHSLIDLKDLSFIYLLMILSFIHCKRKISRRLQ